MESKADDIWFFNLDYTKSSSIEKLLKLIQYSTRFINRSKRFKSLRRLYTHLSTSRRVLRLFKQIKILKVLFSYIQKERLNRKTVFKFAYLCCLFVFLNCDMIILAYKVGYLNNKKDYISLLTFVDYLWLVQNALCLIDYCIKLGEIDGNTELDQKNKNFITNDMVKRIADSGSALCFNFRGFGEEILTFNGILSAWFGMLMNK